MRSLLGIYDRQSSKNSQFSIERVWIKYTISIGSGNNMRLYVAN